MTEQERLPVPIAAKRDEKSVEIFSAWIAENELFCVLRPDWWSDVSAWGLVLADVARHVGDAIEHESGKPAPETVELIKSSFNGELESSTTRSEGEYVDD